MNIIPAIDLQNGKCVRLTQGKLSETTVYNENPTKQAIDFELAGCKKIHIIDIDGAISNISKNKNTILEIIKNVSLKIQLGGGIRSYEQIKFWLDSGIENLIIGSMAFKNPKLLLNVIEEFPNRIIVAIDDNNSKPMISGWTEETKVSLNDAVKSFENEKLKGYVYTDINRDGTLLGLDLNKITKFSLNTKHKIIIGGGLRDMKDIKNLSLLNLKNIEGVIVGKAYYTGSINLKEAIASFENA